MRHAIGHGGRATCTARPSSPLTTRFLGGLFAAANRDWMALAVIFVMGSVWAAAYQRTGTLRWAVASQMLVDLGNLAVPVFMGLYIPPHLA